MTPWASNYNPEKIWYFCFKIYSFFFHYVSPAKGRTLSFFWVKAYIFNMRKLGMQNPYIFLHSWNSSFFCKVISMIKKAKSSYVHDTNERFCCFFVFVFYGNAGEIVLCKGFVHIKTSKFTFNPKKYLIRSLGLLLP